MSPVLRNMFKALELSKFSRTWVVCCESQGKSTAAQFLACGNPKRSLLISATSSDIYSRIDFSSHLSKTLKCHAANLGLSTLLCKALAGKIDDTDTSSSIARTMADMVEDFLYPPCMAMAEKRSPSLIIRSEEIEAFKTVARCCDGTDQSPILIVDDFQFLTEENKRFLNHLARDAAVYGVTVFIMTRQKSLATEIVSSGWIPIPSNTSHWSWLGGKPKWNDMSWTK